MREFFRLGRKSLWCKGLKFSTNSRFGAGWQVGRRVGDGVVGCKYIIHKGLWFPSRKGL